MLKTNYVQLHQKNQKNHSHHLKPNNPFYPIFATRTTVTAIFGSDINTVLAKAIKDLIATKFGSPIRYPKVCDRLAVEISAVTSKQLSASTTRRLMGFTKDINAPRPYTLDIIAEYLGYDTYDDLLNSFNPNSNQNALLERIEADELKIGTVVKVSLNETISFTVVYTGDRCFKITDCMNTNLCLEDTIKLDRIIVHQPLFIDALYRDGCCHPPLVIGRITGVRAIEIIKPTTTTGIDSSSVLPNSVHTK